MSSAFLLASEEEKRLRLAQYVDLTTLDNVASLIASEVGLWCKGCYQGPFGVDMMIAEEQLHPCVEINLRRTMGHVALALTPTDDDMVRVMRIEYADGTYKLKIQRP